MNKNTIIIVAVILILVALGGGFFAGMQYQKSQPRIFVNGAGRNSAGGNFTGRFGGGQNFAPIRGQVLSVGDNSITIKQQDGTSKIAVVSSSTMFVQTQKASVSDLKTGDTIMVVGTSNSDGSVTAQDVQINPQQFSRPTPTGTK